MEGSDSEVSSSNYIFPPPHRNSTPDRAQASASSQFGHNEVRVDKWKLKFTGDNRQVSVHNFLERVSELRIARNISEQELFDSAIDLFTGKALVRFHANRHQFYSWESLSDLSSRHFETLVYRPRLFREMLDRTQDPSECILEYLGRMSA